MKTILISGLLLLLFGNLPAQEPAPVTAVDSVDLERYCGTWYEIARLPNRFQKDCICCTSAEYTLRDDGKITVINRCRKEDGTMKKAEGLAKKADPDGSNAKLKVRFAPSWIGWLPFVWGTYWIIDLADDYSYAVVSEPKREYLWILSRSKRMEPDVYEGILERLRAMGYDTDKLIVAEQE